MATVSDCEPPDPDDPVDEAQQTEYEFPAFNFMEQPLGIWDSPEPGVELVYGGVRLQPSHGMQRSMDCIFTRIQVCSISI